MQHKSKSEQGVALVIALALIVLLTFVVVAFFTRATSSRRIEGSLASRTAADILARSAADIIVADLKTEVVAGSNVFGYASEPPIYEPLSPSNVVPSRVVSPAAASQPSFDNLVKQSVGRFFPVTTAYPNAVPIIQDDTKLSTAVPSLNQRTVSGGRWDMVMLTTPIATPTPPASTNFVQDAIPHWIVMSRKGVAASQSWQKSMKDYTPGNQDAVIGRFAFNVYDIGSLLDVNAIGIPSSITSAGEIQRYKGTLAGVDLSTFPQANPILVNPFTNWRYKASFKSKGAANVGVGTAAEMDAAWDRMRNNGFLAPWQDTVTPDSDGMLQTRQDLIRLASIPSSYPFGHAGIAPEALPFLTHFSREINAPSWWRYPIRVTAAFKSADGTDLQVGQQIVRRFPLTKLDWLGPKGINAASKVDKSGAIRTAATSPSAKDVQAAFGLTWSTDHWIYCGPDPGTVPLDAIGNIPNTRDPNFFELIAEAKRKTTGNADIAEILSIGASMIDHNDGSSLDPSPKVVTSIEYAGPAPSPAPSPVPPNPRAWGMENPLPSPAPSGAPVPPPGTVVLDHTIRSAGEFGYAFKPDKTQTVDFSKAASNDRELLDLFTVSPTRFRAGVVNLNTRNLDVVKALLRKSERNETGQQLTDAAADSAAASIVATTKASPAQTRADIARLVEASGITGTEEDREVVARSLSEVAQTRTWNLLIDVIAQAGRYAPSADKHEDFIVMGEKRYWLSIALDRDTAEVIDQQLELVVE